MTTMKVLSIEQFNEKLDIKPITKERLYNTANGLKMKSVVIGNLEWCAENVKTLYATNGSYLQPNADYFKKGKEIYYTLVGARKIVPNGWRIPTKSDYDNLYDTVGYDNIGKLVSTDYDGGTNEFGFGAKMVGYFSYYTVDTIGVGKEACILIDDIIDAGRVDESYFIDIIYDGYWKMPLVRMNAQNGFSVRFVKDI